MAEQAFISVKCHFGSHITILLTKSISKLTKVGKVNKSTSIDKKNKELS